MLRTFLTPCLALTLAGSATALQAAPCAPDWQPAFGALSSVDGVVYDTIVFDDGSGPALYVGGTFSVAAGVRATNVARFDGTSWSSVGEGLMGSSPAFSSVRAFAVFDDGSGPALYAAGRFWVPGGTFSGNLARWDGASWQPEGFIGGTIVDLVVYDDGGGDDLYAAGDFTTVNMGELSAGIARYDGDGWSAVEAGVWSGSVYSLAVYDDGSGAGPSLFLGGNFSGVRNLPGLGVIPRYGITRWNGNGWSNLGSGLAPLPGVPNTGGYILDMTIHDFGAGPELVVGGSISAAGGQPVQQLARWNGSTWSGVGGGVSGGSFPAVTKLESFDDGTGAQLVVGGRFDMAGGTGGFTNLAAFRGGSWSSPGALEPPDVLGATTLEVFDLGGTRRLAVGGRFEMAGGLAEPWLAAWTGSNWEPIGTPTITLTGEARAFAMFDDGTGRALYAAGAFVGAGGNRVDNVARWNGSGWVSVGGGLPNAVVSDLLVMETSAGTRLFAGGRTEFGQGSGPASVWSYDGTSWAQLPPLPNISAFGGEGILDLEVYAGSGTPELYAAGDYGELTVGSYIARWDGSSWDDLGGGVYDHTMFTTENGISSMVVHDDGAGERLFVAGGFEGVAGLPWNMQASYVAAWDGSSWHRCDGIMGTGDIYVRSIDVVELGGVPRLVACGNLQVGTTSEEFGLASWDGSAWSALPALPSGLGSRQVLRGYDADGLGDVLVVACTESAPGGTFDTALLRLDGTTWTRLGTAVNGNVHALDVVDEGTGSGPLLHVGGDFASLGSMRDAAIARWGGCADRVLGDGFCVATPNSTGVAATTSAFGSPFVAANDVTLTAVGLPPASVGYFIGSRSQGLVPMAGASQGNLCLGGTIGRFSTQVLNAGSSGTFSLRLSLNALPQPLGTVAAQPGETWSFQAWHRDANPTATSNFSRGLEVQLR